MTYNNITVAKGAEICNMFASYFSSTYSKTTTFTCTNCVQNCINTLETIYISRSDIQKNLKRLNPNKGPGPDGITSYFVTRCYSALTLPLYLIYNKSLSEGIFPTAWKRAKVVPIHKTGHPEYISNYRPISILPVFAKVFETLVYPYLKFHFKQHLVNEQHGFVGSRSVNTNLVTYTNYLVDAVDSGHQVDSIYTDFSKAFDRVCHNLLVIKLENYGIHGKLISWFTSYLKNREQYVVVKGFESKNYMASSGVPQGSHLGPWLFNLLINDVVSKIEHSNVYLFADDLKLCKVIKTPEDSLQLQKDINNLSNWCSNNNLTLNKTKCHHIKFTRKHNIFPTHYSIDGIPLQECDKIKDLGILFDTKLTFLPHIDNIISKASKMLGFVIRNGKIFKNHKTKIILYNSYVRSTLEYCSIIWSPHYSVHQLRIERIQKRFTRHLAFYSKDQNTLSSYPIRLKYFKMNSLSDRRKLLDLNFLYKILRNHLDCPPLLDLIKIHVPSRLPRKPMGLLCPPRSRTNLKQNSTIARVTRSYNSLGRSVDVFNDPMGDFKIKVLKLISNKRL